MFIAIQERKKVMRFRKIILSGIISASLAFTSISFASTPQGSITEKSVLEAVEENTKSPGDIESISRLSPSESIELDTKEGLVENKTTDQSVTEILSIERTDGFQIVGVINENHRADSEIRVNFPGMHLRQIEGGTVLVSNDLYGEPEYIIDPAWAEDSIGKEIGTHFEIQGSELVQVINSHESDYTIYAVHMFVLES